MSKDAPSAESMTAADTILYNGRVISMEPDDGPATWVAIRGDRILHVGRTEELPDWRGPRTECINVGGGSILPGFIDAHLHLSIMAEMATQIDVGPDSAGSFAAVKQKIKEEAQRLPDATWIRAFGYDDTKLSGTPLTRRDLDAVAPRHPVYISHVSVHWGLTNTPGLERGGIGEETPDPPGGHLGRDPDSGRLNGLLFEEAAFRYGIEALCSGERVTPPPSSAAFSQGIRQVADLYLKAGITSVHDALATPRFFEVCQQLRREDNLPLRIYGLLAEKYLDTFEASGLRSGFGDEWLRLGAVKLIADGAIAGRTACLKKMIPVFEEAPEPLPVSGGGRDPFDPLFQLLRAGGDRKPQVVERLGADPAEGLPVQRRHPVDKEEKHLQEGRGACLAPDPHREGIEGVEDPQVPADPIHIGKDVEGRLRLQAADPGDGIESFDDQVAPHLEDLHHLADLHRTLR